MQYLYENNKARFFKLKRQILKGGGRYNVCVMLINNETVLMAESCNGKVISYSLPGGQIDNNNDKFNKMMRFFKLKTDIKLPDLRGIILTGQNFPYDTYKHTNGDETIIYYLDISSDPTILMQLHGGKIKWVPFTDISVANRVACYAVKSSNYIISKHFSVKTPICPPQPTMPTQNMPTQTMPKPTPPKPIPIAVKSSFVLPTEPVKNHISSTLDDAKVCPKLSENSFNKRHKCGICKTISDIMMGGINGNLSCLFKGSSVGRRYKWTSAWTITEPSMTKVNPPSQFFHIVPNEHISTLSSTGTKATIPADKHPDDNSYSAILSTCAADTIFKNSLLCYIDMMKQDAIAFAREIMGPMVVPVSTIERYYDKTQIKDGALFIAVHFNDNSQGHMHLHCYLCGSDNFNNTFADPKTTIKFGPTSDLFFKDGLSIALSIDYFRQLIENAK